MSLSGFVESCPGSHPSPRLTMRQLNQSSDHRQTPIDATEGFACALHGSDIPKRMHRPSAKAGVAPHTAAETSQGRVERLPFSHFPTSSSPSTRYASPAPSLISPWDDFRNCWTKPALIMFRPGGRICSASRAPPPAVCPPRRHPQPSRGASRPLAPRLDTCPPSYPSGSQGGPKVRPRFSTCSMHTKNTKNGRPQFIHIQ